MSYFGTALKIVLERRELSQRRLADLAEIDPSLFSRYLAGEVRPSRDFLERLCRSLAESTDRAEIVIAHLRDELPPTAAELIAIINLLEEPGRIGENEPAPPQIKLPRKVRKDFEFLMERAQSQPDIAGWISSTVDVLKGR